MLAQRRPDEQVYVGPTLFSNVGPMESTTEKLRWPNVVMLSGTLHASQTIKFVIISVASHRHISFPSEESRPETLPGNYLGKATPVWQLSLSHRCHQM